MRIARARNSKWQWTSRGSRLVSLNNEFFVSRAMGFVSNFFIRPNPFLHHHLLFRIRVKNPARSKHSAFLRTRLDMRAEIKLQARSEEFAIKSAKPKIARCQNYSIQCKLNFDDIYIYI